MKEVATDFRRNHQAYTLIELVCTLAIIGLMAALLMPAVSKGYARARRAYCINSLRQIGIAFHGFAHGHEDKFPIQVSTNAGGSREWLQSAYSLNDEFYFSYRHFLPLSSELRTPKILTCPADLRQPASHFDNFHNENLSYFVAANPELGKTDSVVAGDRNLSPTFGSMARIGGVLYLKWTRELHEFKGNVLFGDGHVEQMNDILRVTNSARIENLVMPSVPPASPRPTTTSVPLVNPVARAAAGTGSNAASSLMLLTNLMAVTNPVLITTANSPKSGRQPAVPAGSSGSARTLAGNVSSSAAAEPAALEEPAPIEQPLPLPAVPLAMTAPDAPSPSAYERAVLAGKNAFVATANAVSRIPWYLILLLLLAMLELRRRIRKRQQQLARSRFVVPSSLETSEL